MPSQHAALDRVFQALADPTRRAVLQRLAHGRAAVSELARPFDMALPSFLQHLKVLEGSGLVRSQKDGRVRTCELAPEPLEAAEGWMAEQRTLWERRLDQLDRYLGALQLAAGRPSASPNESERKSKTKPKTMSKTGNRRRR
jgi:DNA-binding transcriptional ArsR family regulator